MKNQILENKDDLVVFNYSECEKDFYGMKKENDLSPKMIKKKLIEATLYLSYYELLKNTIIDKISEFFNDEIKMGKLKNSKTYKEQVLSRKIKKKENVFLSSIEWLIENQVISIIDKEIIEKLTKVRDNMAHRLLNYLFDENSIIEEVCFEQIKEINIKIERWWIVEYELSFITNQNIKIADEDIDNVLHCRLFKFNYIYNIAKTDIDEFAIMQTYNIS
jgi:hypothetical protein